MSLKELDKEARKYFGGSKGTLKQHSEARMKHAALEVDPEDDDELIADNAALYNQMIVENGIDPKDLED